MSTLVEPSVQQLSIATASMEFQQNDITTSSSNECPSKTSVETNTTTASCLIQIPPLTPPKPKSSSAKAAVGRSGEPTRPIPSIPLCNGSRPDETLKQTSHANLTTVQTSSFDMNKNKESVDTTCSSGPSYESTPLPCIGSNQLPIQVPRRVSSMAAGMSMAIAAQAMREANQTHAMIAPLTTVGDRILYKNNGSQEKLGVVANPSSSSLCHDIKEPMMTITELDSEAGIAATTNVVIPSSVAGMVLTPPALLPKPIHLKTLSSSTNVKLDQHIKIIQTIPQPASQPSDSANMTLDSDGARCAEPALSSVPSVNRKALSLTMPSIQSEQKPTSIVQPHLTTRGYLASHQLLLEQSHSLATQTPSSDTVGISVTGIGLDTNYNSMLGTNSHRIYNNNNRSSSRSSTSSNGSIYNKTRSDSGRSQSLAKRISSKVMSIFSSRKTIADHPELAGIDELNEPEYINQPPHTGLADHQTATTHSDNFTVGRTSVESNHSALSYQSTSSAKTSGFEKRLFGSSKMKQSHTNIKSFGSDYSLGHIDPSIPSSSKLLPESNPSLRSLASSSLTTTIPPSNVTRTLEPFNPSIVSSAPLDSLDHSVKVIIYQCDTMLDSCVVHVTNQVSNHVNLKIKTLLSTQNVDSKQQSPITISAVTTAKSNSDPSPVSELLTYPVSSVSTTSHSENTSIEKSIPPLLSSSLAPSLNHFSTVAADPSLSNTGSSRAKFESLNHAKPSLPCNTSATTSMSMPPVLLVDQPFDLSSSISIPPPTSIWSPLSTCAASSIIPQSHMMFMSSTSSSIAATAPLGIPLLLDSPMLVSTLAVSVAPETLTTSNITHNSTTSSSQLISATAPGITTSGGSGSSIQLPLVQISPLMEFESWTPQDLVHDQSLASSTTAMPSNIRQSSMHATSSPVNIPVPFPHQLSLSASIPSSHMSMPRPVRISSSTSPNYRGRLLTSPRTIRSPSSSPPKHLTDWNPSISPVASEEELSDFKKWVLTRENTDVTVHSIVASPVTLKKKNSFKRTKSFAERHINITAASPKHISFDMVAHSNTMHGNQNRFTSLSDNDSYTNTLDTDLETNDTNPKNVLPIFDEFSEGDLIQPQLSTDHSASLSSNLNTSPKSEKLLRSHVYRSRNLRRGLFANDPSRKTFSDSSPDTSNVSDTLKVSDDEKHTDKDQSTQKSEIADPAFAEVSQDVDPMPSLQSTTLASESMAVNAFMLSPTTDSLDLASIPPEGTARRRQTKKAFAAVTPTVVHADLTHPSTKSLLGPIESSDFKNFNDSYSDDASDSSESSESSSESVSPTFSLLPALKYDAGNTPRLLTSSKSLDLGELERKPIGEFQKSSSLALLLESSFHSFVKSKHSVDKTSTANSQSSSANPTASRTSTDRSSTSTKPKHASKEPSNKPWNWIKDVLYPKKSKSVVKDVDTFSNDNNPYDHDWNPYPQDSLNGEYGTGDGSVLSNSGYEWSGGRLPSDDEKNIYKLSHMKLAQLGRPLEHQVAISNLMMYILSVHADVTLKRRGPRVRGLRKGGSRRRMRHQQQQEHMQSQQEMYDGQTDMSYSSTPQQPLIDMQSVGQLAVGSKFIPQPASSVFANDTMFSGSYGESSQLQLNGSSTLSDLDKSSRTKSYSTQTTLNPDKETANAQLDHASAKANGDGGQSDSDGEEADDEDERSSGDKSAMQSLETTGSAKSKLNHVGNGMISGRHGMSQSRSSAPSNTSRSGVWNQLKRSGSPPLTTMLQKPISNTSDSTQDEDEDNVPLGMLQGRRS
ncbi:hypothetical protein BDEG_24851 [Batrachochytrium dendrobatidis JEL423]|uniref:Protein Zds1 C-terminal domain-containing protein n=1 Tax=Batrachochytrium dendrobatidis (strain JEL423) TaxID=403673 RepID=A0A177WM76_BATDL|nr:hypothetical protein BDEG_24851 [Batrachochytrium dendrobatidis JEL423]